MATNQISPQNVENPSEHKNISAKCPKCNCTKTIKKGLRKTQHRGLQQRHICKKCQYSFTVDGGFWKMKYGEERICQAIDTYFEGLSLRKIRRNFGLYAGIKPNHQSVLNWIHKYVYLMRNHVATLQPQLSGHYMTDEVIIKCKGKNHNFGVVMDKHTRYVVASRYTESELIGAKDSIKLWSEAKRIQKPYKLSSDSLPTYHKAFRRVFFTRYNKDKVEWNRINVSESGRHNYIMERLWNTLRERIKIMRGFKASWSAKLLIDGFFLWYNFQRPHTTLGQTPAQQTQLRINNIRELIISSI